MKNCKPEEVALKTFFLGPQAENGAWLLSTVVQTFERWFSWRRSICPNDAAVITAADQSNFLFQKNKKTVEKNLTYLLSRFEAEIPKFSPRYIGHMFSETSMPALIGHIVTLLHNPNNISGESSRVGIQIECEAIHLLFSMLGFSSNQGAGHFTSGGTVANFEAVQRALSRLETWFSASTHRNQSLFQTAHRGWRNYEKAKYRDLHTLKKLGLNKKYQKIQSLFNTNYDGPVILISGNMHYSWKKAVNFFGLGEKSLWPINLDSYGRMCILDLKNKINHAMENQIPILMVVSIMGSTETGSIDPIQNISQILEEYRKKKGIHIWHHIDAAYGGFLRSTTKYKHIPTNKAQSITIDPHKLGYVPFASGAFLVGSKKDYFLNSIDAPYLDIKNQDPGPQTIEGSRSGAGAVATWLSLRSIGLDTNGYGRIVEKTVKNRKEIHKLLKNNVSQIQIIPGLDSNILCFNLAKRGERLSKTNQRTLRLYQFFSPNSNKEFMVSKTTLRFSTYKKLLLSFTSKWQAKHDVEEVVLIRLTLMNPFFNSKESKSPYMKQFVSAMQKWQRKEK